MKSMLEKLDIYLEETSEEEVLEQLDKLEKWNNIGPPIDEVIKSWDLPNIDVDD